MGFLVSRAVLPLSLALALAACGGSSDGTPLASAVSGLCEARDQATGGDLDAADTAFQDRSHGELHRLVERVQERDRAAAADVLEAMERVESALGEDNGAEMATLFEELLTATRVAALALEEDVPEC